MVRIRNPTTLLIVKNSVSGPYLLNSDLDPAKNLNPDKENKRIRIQAVTGNNYKIFPSNEVNWKI